jgi:hypothetical protein
MDSNKGQTMAEQTNHDRAMRAVHMATRAAQIIRLRKAAERYQAAHWDSNPQEANDCTVRALEMTTRLSYAEAHALMEKHGRKVGQGAHIDAAVHELGGRRVYDEWYTPRQITVAEATKRYAKGFYIIRIRGHVFAVVDGKQIDCALNTPRHKVRSVFEMPDPTNGY